MEFPLNLDCKARLFGFGRCSLGHPHLNLPIHCHLTSRRLPKWRERDLRCNRTTVKRALSCAVGLAYQRHTLRASTRNPKWGYQSSVLRIAAALRIRNLETTAHLRTRNDPARFTG